MINQYQYISKSLIVVDNFIKSLDINVNKYQFKIKISSKLISINKNINSFDINVKQYQYNIKSFDNWLKYW